MTAALAVVCVAGAVLLALPSPSRLGPAEADPAPAGRSRGWVRLVLASACGALAWVVVGDGWGAATAPVAALAAHRALAGVEPAERRRAREQAAHDLPVFVELLAATLRAGAGPAQALAAVSAALPGAVSERLATVRGRLALGTPPDQAWASLDVDPVLAPLGRAMVRAETSGASVVATVERLADELERRDLATTEDRARAVGVKAAVPLGVCLLPAFLLLGIVPTVAGLLETVLP